MREIFRVTYLNCGFCTAKNHCAGCGRELTEALRARPGIAWAEADLMDHTVTVDHRLTGEALEDLLDGMGLILE